MAFLKFEYQMKISYSEAVSKCYFTIKPIPTFDFRQRCISYDIGLSPATPYSESRDSFGNTQIIGCVNEPHAVFDFTIHGLVETHAVSITGGVDTNTVGMYKYPHGKCIPGEAVKKLYSEVEADVTSCASTREKCRILMHRLHEKMTYEPGSTQVETTAEESLAKGKGVCQDYSHIYICLLRMFGIPARYVCGLIVGEGKSHSWVEAACGCEYVAFDPTHDREITAEYIKLGVGRDASDCAINRGVMWGGGNQSQTIEVTVEKLYE